MAAPVPAVAGRQRFPEKQPLPQNTFPAANEPELHDAYNVCLQNEHDADNDQNLLVKARCLGYMLRELPVLSRGVVAGEIIECVGQGVNIDKLADFYIDTLFRLFRSNKGRTPAPSHHPSRPSFEMHSAFFSSAVGPAPTTHTAAKAAALRRDDFRCMVTGTIDRASYMQMAPHMAQAYVGPKGPTQFCHIFPPSTNWSTDPQTANHAKTKYCGNVWAIINGFDEIDVLSKLNAENIHDISNGLTMTGNVHLLFDDLGLWFEEVPGSPNTYTVCTLLPDEDCLAALPPNGRVTFTSTSAELPLPNPAYLKLHAAVCRIAHMSGVAGYMDLFDRDLETTRVMAHDGTSADLLTSRMQRIALLA